MQPVIAKETKVKSFIFTPTPIDEQINDFFANAHYCTVVSVLLNDRGIIVVYTEATTDAQKAQFDHVVANKDRIINNMIKELADDDDDWVAHRGKELTDEVKQLADDIKETVDDHDRIRDNVKHFGLRP